MKTKNYKSLPIVDYTGNIRIQFARRLSKVLLYFPSEYSIKLRNFISKKIIKKNHGYGICTTLYDIKMLVNIKDNIGSQIYFSGVYEPHTLWLLQKILRNGSVFFDVGAYIGDIACIATNFVGCNGFVYAFEPVLEHYNMMIYNIKINNLRNIKALNYALGDANIKKIMYVTELDNRGTDSLLSTNRNVNPSFMVDVKTIDNLLLEGKIRIPDVIKIDVEGYELNVLYGSKGLLNSPEAPILCVECNLKLSRNVNKLNDMYQYLVRENKYHIFKISLNKFKKIKLIEIHDILNLPSHGNIYGFLDKHIEKYKHLNIINFK